MDSDDEKYMTGFYTSSASCQYLIIVAVASITTKLCHLNFSVALLNVLLSIDLGHLKIGRKRDLS